MAYEGQRIASYAGGGPALQRVSSYIKSRLPNTVSTPHVPVINRVDSSAPGGITSFGPGGSGFQNINSPGEDED